MEDLPFIALFAIIIVLIVIFISVNGLPIS